MAWGAKPEDTQLKQLGEKITELTKEVASLTGERDYQESLRDLSDERNTLQEKITQLKIEKGKIDEEHARDKREVEHMVGLEKKRAEQEATLAVREATLKVKEDAVTSQVDAIKKELEITSSALAEQIKYLKDDIIKEVFALVPKVEVSKQIRAVEK